MRDFDPTASEFITSGYIQNSRPGGRLYDPSTIMGAASLASGLLGANSSRSAASAQADSAQRATDQQAAQYAQQRADLQPWAQSGGQANNKLSALMGMNGEDQTAQLQATPGYQFRLDQGMQGVQNSAAARGGLLSGGTLKAIQKYGQDFASNEYQNQFNRLNSMSSAGQNAAAGQGNAAQAFGAAQAQNTMGAGNALASGIIGGANSMNQGVSNAINGYQQNQMMNLLGNRTPVTQNNKMGWYE
jgi:hypothetical protein